MTSSFTSSLFSEAEYRRRLRATQAAIIERGADLALVHQPEHLYYLTGFPGPGAGYGFHQVCIVPAEGEPVVVLRKMEEQAFLVTTWVKDYYAYNDYEDPVDTIRKAMEEHGFADKTAAVEYDSWALTHTRLNRIKEVLPRLKLVDFSRVLWYLRQVKSDEELAYIQRAADIAIVTMKKVIDTVEEGRTEHDIQMTVRQVYHDEGADGQSGGTFNSGNNIRFVHASPTKRVLGKGDILNTELTPVVQNYHARFQRSTVIGEPTDEQKRIARVVEEAQSDAIALMKPGAQARDVDHAVRSKIEREGVKGEWESPYYNISGYTLGIIMMPWISDFSRVFLPTSDWVLEEDNVYHLYCWAQGIAFSETVHVTADGPELMTKMERKLYVK